MAAVENPGMPEPQSRPGAAGAIVPSTRREARLAYQAREAAAQRLAAEDAARAKREELQRRRETAAAAPRRRFKGAAKAVVVVMAVGIVGTVAIPAYAYNPNTQGQSNVSSSFGSAGSQSVTVADSVSTLKAERETYTTLTPEQADAQRAAAAQHWSTAYAAAYTGPTVSDFLKNPPYPSFSLAQVFDVAKKYIGVPYVYGGDTPAGFDCSGFVMFVYAQFGIALPHSASEQGAIGTRIDPKDAEPGDVIVLDDGSHVGFYAGPGMILDAPDSGKSISIRPMWTNAYYIVRFGIKGKTSSGS